MSEAETHRDVQEVLACTRLSQVSEQRGPCRRESALGSRHRFPVVLGVVVACQGEDDIYDHELRVRPSSIPEEAEHLLHVVFEELESLPRLL